MRRLQRPLLRAGDGLHGRLRFGPLRMRLGRAEYDLLHSCCEWLRRLRNARWQPRHAVRLWRVELDR